MGGFDQVVGVVPVLARQDTKQIAGARSALRLQLDETTKSLKRSKIRAARIDPARVIDASAGGLGLAMRRGGAAWAKHGMLVAVVIEPGKDWFVGVLAADLFDRRGVCASASRSSPPNRARSCFTRPRPGSNLVWDEAIRTEKNFSEHFRYAILLEPAGVALRHRGSAARPGHGEARRPVRRAAAGRAAAHLHRPPARRQRALPARAVRAAGRHEELSGTLHAS